MERIGGDVRLVLSRFGSVGAMEQVVRAWPDAVGDAVARNAWPSRLGRDGTLYVATSSSTWAFELTQLADQIRVQLRDRLGAATPGRVRFVPGQLPAPGPEPVEHRPVPVRPGAEERAAAERVAAAIEDEELRRLVAEVVAASLATGGSGRRL